MFTLNTAVLSYNQIFFSNSADRIHPLLLDECLPEPKHLLKKFSSPCGCKDNSQNMK